MLSYQWRYCGTCDVVYFLLLNTRINIILHTLQNKSLKSQPHVSLAIKNTSISPNMQILMILFFFHHFCNTHIFAQVKWKINILQCEDGANFSTLSSYLSIEIVRNILCLFIQWHWLSSQEEDMSHWNCPEMGKSIEIFFISKWGERSFCESPEASIFLRYIIIHLHGGSNPQWPRHQCFDLYTVHNSFAPEKGNETGFARHKWEEFII